MTLRGRIVAAMVAAALVPMAVALALPLARAERRAVEETARRAAQASRRAALLVAEERARLRTAADRAADDLAGDHDALTALVRGPDLQARLAARGLAERHGLARVEIVGGTGAVLAAHGDAGEAGAAVLAERRVVRNDAESLTLVAAEPLGVPFTQRVAALTEGEARLARAGETPAAANRVEIAVIDGIGLVVDVPAADVKEVRRDLLRSFAGIAPVAILAALLAGLVLSERIARPIRALADRAEGISAERSRPITLLHESDETRRLTLAFDQMLDALSSSERQRLAAERVAAWEEIARRLAHEIKNPLSPIQLAVENLRRARERAPAEFESAFDVEARTILEEVGSLRRLVDEFAQFARLPRPDAVACDPRAVLEQALALFASRVEAEGVTVTVDAAGAPASLRADPEQLGRALKNVIANALDALEGARRKDLRATIRAGRAGATAVFEIVDTGGGFEPEVLRRVFEPYFTTRGDRGGTGLGMAIARRIAIEHGGTIRAEGAVGRGAAITIEVPVAGPPPDRA